MPLMAGEGFVVVKWEIIIVIGRYVSPNITRAWFDYLSRLREVVCRRLPFPVIVEGDLNVKSAT